MNKTNNSKLTGYAKTLRKNMTKEERHLWYDFLKNLSVTVNRQKVIGKYIVDFYIASARIAIELDGSQHYEEENIKDDKERDKYLNEIGIKVLRYSNLDINSNFNEVCQNILTYIDTSSDG
ncbi:MAG: endonuclease domain-containing protein [Clostridia bacterium]